MDKYYVVATIFPKAGKEDEVQALILDNIPKVRQEQGCLRYDLHRNRKDNTFVFYEIWADKDALTAHGNAPHMLAYREKTRDLLEKPTDVTLWSAVDVVA